MGIQVWTAKLPTIVKLAKNWVGVTKQQLCDSSQGWCLTKPLTKLLKIWFSDEENDITS